MGRLILIAALCFGALLLRLVQLQLIDVDEHRAKIQASREVRVEQPARRGDILDRHGRPLARTVDSYALHLLPASFREGNRLDALADLARLLFPDALPFDAKASEEGRRRRQEGRLARYMALRDSAPDLLRRLYATPMSSIRGLDAEAIGEGLEPVLWPKGELILPPSMLRGRVGRCLDLLGRRDRGRSEGEARSVQERLGQSEGATLAEIRREVERLDWVAKLAQGESLAEFLPRLFSKELSESRRIEERLEEMIDDAIAIEELGTHDLAASLDSEGRLDLARQLELPASDPEGLSKAFADLEERVAEKLADAGELELYRAGLEILGGRRFDQLKDYERSATARLLGVWDARPAELKRAMGRRAREQDDYDRRRYLSRRKEWQRRLQYKSWFSYELARDCPFDLARAVWADPELGALGLRVKASLGRRYWADDEGVASALVGRLTDTGLPLKGLERRLDSQELPGGGRLRGETGLVIKQREPDGTLRELRVERPRRDGRDVTLCIDREWQRWAEEELEVCARELRSKTGGAAFCLIDIASAEILVLASIPRLSGDAIRDAVLDDRDRRLNANAWREAYRRGDIDAVTLATERRRSRNLAARLATVDRASEAGDHAYAPPGSVVKAFMGLLQLQSGVLDAGESLDCGTRKAHGRLSLDRAIVLSCNGYFWKLGKLLGRDRIRNWYGDWGMFQEVPYLRSAKAGKRIYDGLDQDSSNNLSIGQGNLNTSPLELATMMANLGRDGVIVTPRIMRAIDGIELSQSAPRRLGVSAQDCRRIRQAMRGVYLKYARLSSELRRHEALGIAGKTGTGDYYTNRPEGDNIAWYAGLAPFDAPRYAFAIFCERTRFKGKDVMPYLGRILTRILEDRAR